MKYTDFIEGNEGFQYSVNLQYDLYNAIKVKGYIPTKKSVELLYEYLLNTKLKDRNKSTVLIGPYGKGKSHLLLILLNVLVGLHKEEIKELITKIAKVDKNCADLIEEIYEKNKYVPIILNSNSMDLNQSFLIAMRQALKSIGAEEILPNTYFDAAVDVINGWKSYQNTFEKFEELVKEACNIDVEIFIKNLKGYNVGTYNLFKDLFKEITSGVEFNPLINTDIVKLYEQVNHILHERYDYKGLIIVFDEFSKFIEASATHNTSRDLKILQDFAELASRSESPQMHLICVTHKTVNEYIAHIPKDKVDAWRAIEGRFTEIYFNSSAQQNYELISNAIIKDKEKFNQFWCKYSEDYAKYNEDSLFLFNDIYSEAEFKEVIIKGCFPLNPYATYVLPKISEKVAQNERTLFTFLSKFDRNSLLDIVRNNKGEKELVTTDSLYDYFEPLFKKEVFNEKISSLWLKTDAALNHVEDEDEKVVIKAVSICNIINDTKYLPTTLDNVRKSIGYSKAEMTKTFNKLRDKNVLILRKSNNTIDFMPISGIDIEKKIKAAVEVKKKNLDISKVLDEMIDLKYVLPRKYNDDYKMVRYFRKCFMTQKELFAYDSSKLLLESKDADGLFINVIYESKEEKTDLTSWIESIEDRRIGLIIPKEIVKLREVLTRYVVINDFLNDIELLNEDAVIESQLSVLLEDSQIHIKDLVEKKYNLTNKNSVLNVNGEILKDINDIEMSQLASNICFEYYDNSPIVNNELVNKQKISSPILKARNSIVNSILNSEYKNFNYIGSSVECTLFRTTIKNKGLLEEEEQYALDIIPLLKEIKEFINKSEDKEISFNDLYKNITDSVKGIAVRKGIVPIYLAFILKDYLNEAIIYVGDRKKKEVALTTDIINNINDKPNSYYLKIEKGTKEKEDYLLALDNLFEEYKNKRVSEGKYVDIVKAIQVWIQSLSKYSRIHEVNIVSGEKINSEIIKLRNALVKFDINSREFIFKDLPKIFKTKDLQECFEKINEAKNYLERQDSELRKELCKKTLDIINNEYKGSVTSGIKTWLYGIEEEKLTHLYDVTINSALEILRINENNEELLVSKLAYTLTGLALEDWNDDSISVYTKELKRVKETIESYEVACDSNNNEGLIKISFIANEANINEKTFGKAEISPLGNMLLNNLEDTLDEFGDSIDDNEKRNILIKMIEKFI